jgi:hypothetical protein
MNRRLAICCLAAVMAAAVSLAADSVRIVPIVNERQVLVSFEMSDVYSEDVREMISSGLRTSFTYDIELRMLVPAWVDRTIATATVTMTDDYDNLTRRHNLTRMVDGRMEDAVVTEDESEVKRWLTALSRLPLCSTSKLERNRDYYLRVSGRQRPQRSFPFGWAARITGQAKFTFIP